MSENSKIEWTDHTFNPWIGCTKVSPGCANCYAATQDTFRKWTPEGWGKGKPRKRTKTWAEPVKWNAAAETFAECICGFRGKIPFESMRCPECERSEANRLTYRRPRVFCASLADWLDEEVPIEWLADLLALIHATPHLDWQLLTKRPGNWQARIDAVWALPSAQREDHPMWGMRQMLARWMNGRPPANVWIGTTVEDQARADERIPQLLAIPARVRFLSCEPLLGPVDLRHCLESESFDHSDDCQNDFCALSGGLEDCKGVVNQHESIHWVICGGESGSGARPMHPDWAKSLRDQCAAAQVPFLFKQWGEWIAWDGMDDGPRYVGSANLGTLKDPADDFSKSPMQRVGKKRAGRLLDGREWNGFPHFHEQTTHPSA